MERQLDERNGDDGSEQTNHEGFVSQWLEVFLSATNCWDLTQRKMNN